jgi:hypothetical protein
VGGLCDGCEVGAEIRLTCPVGEVPDEQTDCQSSLVKSATCVGRDDSNSETAMAGV